MENKTVLGILVAFLLIGFIVQGAMVVSKFSSDGVTQEQVQQVVREEVAKIVIPAQPVPVIPTAAEIAAEINVENADNDLLNKFLESRNMFATEIVELEDEAKFYALEELEDHDYRVVVDYLMSLVEGVDEDELEEWLDEHSFIEDTDVKVTKLGLEEDEDKSARVTYELEVDYEVRVESEYGYVIEDYSKDLVVVYDVVFEEGDFSDEEVTFVSIV